MVVQERYHGMAMAANSTYSMPQGSSGIGGFICVTAGTLTITGATGTILLNAFPVSAGQVYGIPMYFGINGGTTIALAGGASGSLLKQ